MEQQLIIMLNMQDRMNSRVHSEWRVRQFAWYRALWLECGELIDHYGYKWWKKQVPDMAQVQLEVVDIWHFGLSMLFDGRSIEEIAAELERQRRAWVPQSLGVLEAAEALAEQTLVTRSFSMPAFMALMDASELDFDALYRAYVSKNVLNFFRQDHGYQEGTYQKNWSGREDNTHLLELLEPLDAEHAEFPERLYQALTERYTALVTNPDVS